MARLLLGCGAAALAAAAAAVQQAAGGRAAGEGRREALEGRAAAAAVGGLLLPLPQRLPLLALDGVDGGAVLVEARGAVHAVLPQTATCGRMH